jgi:hypothetical protein
MARTAFFYRLVQGIARIIASRWFFGAVVGLFVLQAVFISLVGRYSMAFDEYYHYELIQQYARVLWPWSVAQPPGPAELGAVTTDTSYLYHWLMSFPYRFIRLFTDSLQSHLVFFRLIDVAIVGFGLFVYRKLLLKIGVSRAATHGILAVLVLVPVTTFLAGQLTYDALMFTMTGVAFLYTVKLLKEIQSHSVTLSAVLLTISLLMLASITKYAFFVIAVIIGIILSIEIYLAYRPKWSEAKRYLNDAAGSLITAVRVPAGALIIGLFLVASLLFLQRYGLNVARYGTPVPDCGTAISESRCKAYAPYGRNIAYKEAGYANNVKAIDVAYYPIRWSAKMMRSLFFVVAPREAGYKPGNPLPIAKTAGNIIAWGIIVLIFLGLPWLLRSAVLRLLLLASVGYIGLLFARNFSEYVSLGVPVAINGRYILYLLPVLAALAYLSAKHLVVKAGNKKDVIWVAGSYGALLIGMFMIFGGGFLPFVIRSGDEWMWPNAVEATREFRSLLWPYVLKEW